MEINGYTIEPKVDLQEANLQGANLRGVDLQVANLQGANLRGVDLQGANLQGANLRGVDLQEANLKGANLQGANLRGADLRGTNLKGANLQGANLDFSCFPLWCGSFNATVDDSILEQLLTHIKRLDTSHCSEKNKKLISSIPKRVENKLKQKHNI